LGRECLSSCGDACEPGGALNLITQAIHELNAQTLTDLGLGDGGIVLVAAVAKNIGTDLLQCPADGPVHIDGFHHLVHTPEGSHNLDPFLARHEILSLFENGLMIIVDNHHKPSFLADHRLGSLKILEMTDVKTIAISRCTNRLAESVFHFFFLGFFFSASKKKLILNREMLDIKKD
jgi:hypothetical protein